MSFATSLSEGHERTAVLSARADGAAEIVFACTDGVTRLAELYQSDPCRVLLPRPGVGEPATGIIVTTSGGVVGGDRLRYAVKAAPGAVCSVTSQAAEKIYRSAGEDSRIAIELRAESGATLEWMPQETIVFDGARLRRTTDIDLAGDARLIAGEMIVFGRLAHGERFGHGFLHDGWRLRRDGRLKWADGLRLDRAIGETLARPSAFDGAAAMATLIYVAADAASRLEVARSWLEPLPGEARAAVSVVGDVLLIRMLGRDPSITRRAFAAVWSRLRAETLGFPARLPRIWDI